MPSPMTDAELYARGAQTILAAWEAVARGSRGAAVVRLPGVACGVFPHEPERTIYNNALLERGLDAAGIAGALAAMEAAYASAQVAHFAAWAHESDEALCAALAARGYVIAEATRAMGMPLSALRLPRPQLALAPPDWAAYSGYLAGAGAPEGLLSGVDPGEFHLLL